MLGRREEGGVRGMNVREQQAKDAGDECGRRAQGAAGKNRRGKRGSREDRAREERATLSRVRQEHQLVTGAYSYLFCSIFLSQVRLIAVLFYVQVYDYGR